MVSFHLFLRTSVIIMKPKNPASQNIPPQILRLIWNSPMDNLSSKPPFQNCHCKRWLSFRSLLGELSSVSETEGLYTQLVIASDSEAIQIKIKLFWPLSGSPRLRLAMTGYVSLRALAKQSRTIYIPFLTSLWIAAFVSLTRDDKKFSPLSGKVYILRNTKKAWHKVRLLFLLFLSLIKSF